MDTQRRRRLVEIVSNAGPLNRSFSKLWRRAAPPNRSQRTRDARSNGEEMRSFRRLARLAAPSTAHRHLIHEFHSWAHRCAATTRREPREGSTYLIIVSTILQKTQNCPEGQDGTGREKTRRAIRQRATRMFIRLRERGAPTPRTG